MCLIANKLEVSLLGKRNSLLKEISFELNSGEILALFGRNGSGKSTLFQNILGLKNSNNIDIRINGQNIKSTDIIGRKKIAFLPQFSFMPKDLSVLSFIQLFIESIETQEKIIYSPKVNDLLGKKIRTLSCGEKRYLEVLYVSYLDHPFVIYDEPFSMVEPIYVEFIKDLFLSVKKTKGILLTDHYHLDTLEVGDSFFLIKDGLKKDIINQQDLLLNNYLTS